MTSLTVRPDEQFGIVATTKIHNSTRPVVNGSPITAMDNTRDAPAGAVARIPAALKFPLVVITNFTLSLILHTLVADLTGPELASVSRDLTAGWQIAGIVGWKLTELGIAWYMRYDYSDLAWLTLLTNVPHYFLLNTFYGIDYIAAMIPLAIDIAAIAVPFAILRGLDRSRISTTKTPNQAVAQDLGIQWLIGLFGACLYTIVIYGSYYTWLPQHMVVHFDGLRSVEKAHDAGIILLLALLGPVGYATTHFIFVPAIGSAGNPGNTDPNLYPEKLPFDPKTATFSETLAWNLGLSEAGFSRRAEILAKRTAALAVCSFTNAFVRAYVTVEGTEVVGALGWASVWAMAAAVTGVAFSWVGDE